MPVHNSRGSRGRLLFMLGLVALGIPGLWLLARVTGRPETPTPFPPSMLRWAGKLFTGTTHLAGVVVDEEGNPLEDVRVAITEGRSDISKESFSTHWERERIVNGHFSERCWGCLSLTLTFVKSGYFEERIWSDTNSADLQVVLMKEGLVAPLVRIGGGISGGPSEQLKILCVEPRTGRHAPSTVVLRGTELFVVGSRRKDETEKTPVSAPYLYLTSPGGLGAPFEAGPRQHPTGERVEGLPVSVSLCASQDGDGFAEYEPRRAESHLAYREMREAPADGYRRCMPAPVWPTARPTVFFYCKFGSFYGKGEISQAHFSGFKPGVVEAPVWLLVNPDGTRNVAGVR